MRNKKLIRFIAIVLAVLLVGGVVVGALLSAIIGEVRTALSNASGLRISRKAPTAPPMEWA